MTGQPRWVLWSGTIGLESPLEVRAPAALAAGCERVSLSPLDLDRAAAEGVSATDVGRRFADAGLGLVMDPVMNWYGGRPRPESRFARFSADDALRMCEQVGAVSMTVLGQAPDDDTPLDVVVAGFADVCRRARDLGMVVHLEFTPLSSIADLRTGWAIVEAADAPNGGLLFDAYHFFRGDPDLSLLATIPGERILAVQLDDALAQVRGTLREDTQHRLLPGDGELDLVSAIAVLAEIGGLSWVGPEVLSPDLAAMPPTQAATLAMDRVRALVPPR